MRAKKEKSSKIKERQTSFYAHILKSFPPPHFEIRPRYVLYLITNIGHTTLYQFSYISFLIKLENRFHVQLQHVQHRWWGSGTLTDYFKITP